MKNLKFISINQLVLVLSLIGLMVNCGGGANDESEDQSVFITLNFQGIVGTAPQDNNEYIEVDMIQNLNGSTGVVVVDAASSFGANELDASVATVVMDRWEIVYTRNDGGSPNLGNSGRAEGPMDGTVVAPNRTSSRTSAEFEIPLVSAYDKIYGPLAMSFLENPSQSVEFSVRITCFGRNLAGQNVQASTGITLHLAVFEPIDDLLPNIVNFSHISEGIMGTDWAASWTAFGNIEAGALQSPFGPIYSLAGTDFPVGNISLNTAYLIPTYQGLSIFEFPAPILTVFNAFGSAVAEGENVTLSIPADPNAPTPGAVEIDQFFADRYSLPVGESTNLSWVVNEGPTELQMIPSSFSGVPVNFSDKDLSFDSVTVIPETSVRPILRAYKESNKTEDAVFLDQDISVTGGVGPEDPAIVFFTASHNSVPRYQQVALYWKVVGDYERVELFPVQGQVKDVTGRESILTPPLNRLGSNPFRLAVIGVGGAVVADATLTVDVTDEEINEPVEISQVVQSPGPSIDNEDEGAFSFRLDDPENQDISWVVQLIAGDNAFYGPNQGLVDGGHGDGSVSFRDGADNASGFLTFQISAYDNNNYGLTALTNRTVQLVTFNTTGGPSFGAPLISGVTFTAGNAGEDLLPGQDGVISFRVTDTDTAQIAYSVEIIAGDRGGLLNGQVDYTEGQVQLGGAGVGDVVVQYQDDPDSTDDAVVFQITATEISQERQQSIAVLRVPYGTDVDGTITFPHIGLYTNGAGTVDATQRIAFYLNYDGTSANSAGTFYQDHDLTNPITDLSLILDLQHGSDDPGAIASVESTRNFVSPLTDNENYNECNFMGYFTFPGVDTVSGSIPTPDPMSDTDVSRWNMPFNVENFRADTGTSYNLPIVDGQIRVYQVEFEAEDKDNVREDVTVTLTVESVN